MKFRLFNGLFFDLPYEQISQAGMILPLFSKQVLESLNQGKDPLDIMKSFFSKTVELKDFKELVDVLFAILRLTERQIVLFDAVEEASFSKTRDLEGPGSLHDLLVRVEKSGKSQDLAKLLDEFKVRIVLTAHPTQFYTEQVLGIIHELRDAISSDNLQKIYKLLLQLGRTRFKKRLRPSPWDEAKGVVWFMETVLYKTLPEIEETLFRGADYECDVIQGRIPIVELGFWPGGDRDGNPFVDTETTLRVAKLLHDSLINLYLKDLAELSKRLTFDGVSEKLLEIREKLETRLTAYSHLRALGNKQCSDDTACAYRNKDEYLSELLELRRMLLERHEGLFVEDLEECIHRVHCFGFYFGILDLRQDSRVLAKIVAAYLEVRGQNPESFLQADQKARFALLSKLDLVQGRSLKEEILKKLDDPVLRDGIEVLSIAETIQEINGSEALHRFIISNTNGPADVLGLLHLCYAVNKKASLLDISPLFETVDDLKNSQASMLELFENQAYQQHLALRGKEQHIMLGFSDGTKDGGYLAANWSIYRAKQALTHLARSKNIKVIFFDGRGGPPARGGGNTHKFYQSLGRDIESKKIHLTIQGQTISSMYGNPISSRFNLEQLMSASLDNNLFPQTEEWHLSEDESKTLNDLSDIARSSYLELRGHPDFMDYLSEISPLKFYGDANISSRPTKRPGSKKLGLEDLRAIPFVGSWSQIKQNIPGYYGLGSALHTLYLNNRGPEVQQLYKNSLFFRTLLDNSSQSLCKVYLSLTAWCSSSEKHKDIYALIKKETELTVQMLLKISGTQELLELDPMNKASICMREDIIIPIAFIQQWALRQLALTKENPKPQDPLDPGLEDQEVLKKIIIKSMAICVNASRNSV